MLQNVRYRVKAHGKLGQLVLVGPRVGCHAEPNDRGRYFADFANDLDPVVKDLNARLIKHVAIRDFSEVEIGFGTEAVIPAERNAKRLIANIAHRYDDILTVIRLLEIYNGPWKGIGIQLLAGQIFRASYKRDFGSWRCCARS